MLKIGNPHRKSDKFIPDSDVEFADMARAFAAEIARDPGRYNLAPEHAKEISAAVKKFNDDLLVALSEGTRNKITIMQKDESRAACKRIIEEYGRVIRADCFINPADKISLGIKERAKKLKRRECPTTPPQLLFVRTDAQQSTGRGKHILRYCDLIGDGKRSKPLGALFLELAIDYVLPNTAMPEHPAQLRGWENVLQLCTRSPVETDFPLPPEPAMVVYWGRWVGSNGKKGPWSKTCVGHIECGWNGTGMQIEDQSGDKRRISPLIIERVDTERVEKMPRLPNQSNKPKQLPDAA